MTISEASNHSIQYEKFLGNVFLQWKECDYLVVVVQL